METGMMTTTTMMTTTIKSRLIPHCFSPGRSGMIGWVAQGLTKVLPQPDSKYKETEEKEEHTEVRRTDFIPVYQTSRARADVSTRRKRNGTSDSGNNKLSAVNTLDFHSLIRLIMLITSRD